MSSTVNVNLDVCAGIEGYFQNNVFTAYPNPFSGRLTVDNISGETLNYSLFTVAGVVIKSGSLSGTSFIETDGFAAGVYFLKVTSGDKAQTIRVVKK